MTLLFLSFPQHPVAIVLFDFDAMESGELGLTAGETVYVLLVEIISFFFFGDSNNFEIRSFDTYSLSATGGITLVEGTESEYWRNRSFPQ
jgi:hypothetical protein